MSAADDAPDEFIGLLRDAVATRDRVSAPAAAS